MDTSLALAITKAIGYTENGGKPDIQHPKAGKTGEAKSIFQFTPATWDNYSHQVAGKKLPLTPDNETQVVTEKVSKWLEKGYTPEQIFSMWNAGTGEPDAYTGKFSDGQASVGVNKKYGVRFDVPSYVQNGMKYLNEFHPQLAQKVQQAKGQEGQIPAQQPLAQAGQQSGTQNTSHANPLEDIMTALQSKINPKSTPSYTKNQPSAKPRSEGLVAGMLPQIKP